MANDFTPFLGVRDPCIAVSPLHPSHLKSNEEFVRIQSGNFSVPGSLLLCYSAPYLIFKVWLGVQLRSSRVPMIGHSISYKSLQSFR